MADTVRTRIAPSPTGNLHVGNARAALFNELFARQHGGQFIIRIEDTNAERSTPEFERNILEGLAWLGLHGDEGPNVLDPHKFYRQSERTALYQSAIEELLKNGHAYQEAGSEAVKLKVEPAPITFTDLIRGEVTVHPDAWGGDFVIARSLSSPVFHLAVVVDDNDLAISHVIRGEDHLSNTARHILIQRALGYPTPQYAHLPLLLDKERRKLSKRSGDTDVLSYRSEGFLPEAMLNYLALLGWNPGTDQEFFSHEELIKTFSLEQVQKSGAIFDKGKLVAMNQQHMRALVDEEFFERCRSYLEAAGYDVTDSAYWTRAAATEKERAGTLGKIAEYLEYFKPDWPVELSTDLHWRKSDPATTKNLLEQLMTKLESLTSGDFSASKLEEILLAWIDENDLGRGDTLWPMRVALTGREHSPGPFEVAAVLGKAETLRRLKIAHDKLTT